MDLKLILVCMIVSLSWIALNRKIYNKESIVVSIDSIELGPHVIKGYKTGKIFEFVFQFIICYCIGFYIVNIF